MAGSDRKNFADALAPLASSLRDRRPLVRPVSRAAFEIGGDNAFDQAVREAVVWMRNRCPAIPTASFEGSPFLVGGGGENHAEAVSFDYDGGRLWASTLDFPDTDPRRTWVTEITVGEQRGRTAFGARLLNVTRGEDFPFVASRPGVVRQVISKLDASADGENLGEAVWMVDADYEFDAFFDVLTNQSRSIPILAMAAGVDHPQAIDADEMAKRLSGLAHLVVLGEDASWELTRRLGKRLSVFNGGARIYRSKFDPDSSDPFDQPLWLPRPTDSPETLAQRIEQVASVVCGISLRPPPGTDFPRFAEVQRAAAERASARARSQGSQVELVELYEDEIARLKASLESQKGEHDELLAMADQERLLAVESAEELKVDLVGLRSRVTGLEASLRARGQVQIDEPLRRYDEIEEWANKHLSGSIWIAPKAIKETEKRGEFRDPELVGNALLILRDYYVPMRRTPGDDIKKNYDQVLVDNRLSDDPCMSNKGGVRSDPSYSVRYRNDKYWCERHIKFGGGLDPRDFFRIYYHWHEEEEVLLIGHMPTHLDNDLTN